MGWEIRVKRKWGREIRRRTNERGRYNCMSGLNEVLYRSGRAITIKHLIYLPIELITLLNLLRAVSLPVVECTKLSICGL